MMGKSVNQLQPYAVSFGRNFDIQTSEGGCITSHFKSRGFPSGSYFYLQLVFQQPVQFLAELGICILLVHSTDNLPLPEENHFAAATGYA